MHVKLPLNYKTASTPDLLRLKIVMEGKKADIDHHIDINNLRSPRPAKGFGSDEWFARADLARKKYGCDIQRIQLVLIERNIPDGKPGSALAKAFIEAARRRLDKVVFDSIMSEAKEEQEI